MQPDNFAIPQLNGETLILPGRKELLDTIHSNHHLLLEYDFDFAGRPFQTVLASSRRLLTRIAADYTASLGGDPQLGGSDIIVACGHQPTFYHTGVWIKNHIISWLAGRLDATSINTIINSDHAGSVTFRTICDGDNGLEQRQVVLAEPGEAATFEDFMLEDIAAVEVFCDQVSGALTPMLGRHRFGRFAELLRERAEHSLNLADLLTFARRHIEREEDIHNLELPISLACDTDTFRLLFLHILRDAPRFVEQYNRALHEYRTINSVRSRSNPLPDLAQDVDTWEQPFWLTLGAGPRKPCFVRILGERLTLFSDRNEVCVVRRGEIDDGETAVGILRRLTRDGYRFRLKAVTNSIFSRLLLGDVFIHGIGGAKYDFITDQVFGEFFDVPVPAGGTASATVHLPIRLPSADQRDPGSIKTRIHTMRSNPASVAAELLPGDAEVARMMAEKRELAKTLSSGTRREKRRAFSRAKQIDAELAHRLEPFIMKEQDRLDVAERAARQREAVEARDYPVYLFPPGELRKAYGFDAN